MSQKINLFFLLAIIIYNKEHIDDKINFSGMIDVFFITREIMLMPSLSEKQKINVSFCINFRKVLKKFLHLKNKCIKKINVTFFYGTSLHKID